MSQSSSFTSALPINQHLRLQSDGLEPMAIVTGASVYHLGWQIPAWSQAKELETVTRALAHARELALEKLRAAGRHLGAEAIVGVTLDTRPQSPGRRLTEVVALGTAVRDRAGLLRRAPGNEIVTSNLSGQEMALLIQSGHQPVALVAGNCVYHAGYQNASRWLSQVGRNVEMPTFTQALADARELALARMQAEATASGADGILGVALTEHEHAWGSHVIECFVLGTAIAATGETPSLGDVPFILSLNDPPEPMPPRHRLPLPTMAEEPMPHLRGLVESLPYRPTPFPLDAEVKWRSDET